MTTLSVLARKSGTYTLRIDYDPPIIWRTGIPTRTEALSRARLIAGWCGYRVKER